MIYYESPKQPKEPFSNSDGPFTQEALFFWLTGWPKPDSAIIIDIISGEQTLVIPVYSRHYEIWTGPIPQIDEVRVMTGVDQVITDDQVESFLKGLNSKNVYSAPGAHVRLNDATWAVEERGLFTAACIARMIKAEEEISCLRTAADLTGQAIVKVWKDFKWHPGMKEIETQALFKYHGALLGCKDHSFLTIAGAGGHSCYLHYTENTGDVRADDLMLLDCGLFYEHYAGDITRTFPVSGRFSENQRMVYNLLLKRQIELIELVGTGRSLIDLETCMWQKIFEILQELGVVPVSVRFDPETAFFFCPHSVSHHIGCNVHDQCQTPDGYEMALGADPFAAYVMSPGMVISIEPGIYFHPTKLATCHDLGVINMERALELSRTVGGIRIEDDVLVTLTGHEVLSKNCPKTVEEIETLMRH